MITIDRSPVSSILATPFPGSRKAYLEAPLPGMVNEADALPLGMEEKAREFRAAGAAIYQAP